MATESPMRMVETGGARKWNSSNDDPTFGNPLRHAEEIGLLLNTHRFFEPQTDTIPSRSGSAPPSMEGSFTGLENLLAQQSFSMNYSFESLGSAIENSESEKQLRSDPAYFAYYCSNVNLNPRLPPPLMSRENRRLVNHIGGFGSNQNSASVDDSGNTSLPLSRVSLSTHKEEPEDEWSPEEASEKTSLYGQNTTTLTGLHKSLVDLIQEDFPRTPSPVYSQSRSSSYAAEEMRDHEVHGISSDVSSISISKLPELDLVSDVCVDAFAREVEAARLISDDDPSTTNFPSSSCHDGTPIQLKGEADSEDTRLQGNTSVRVSLESGIAGMESRMRNRQEEQSSARNIPQNHSFPQHGILHQAPVDQAQVSPKLSGDISYGGLANFSQAHSRFTSEGYPLSSFSSLNPHLDASGASFMARGTSFYPNFQPSGLYSPQYGMGGYALGSPFLPSFMTNHPSYGSIPVTFGATGQSIDGRPPAASRGENIPYADSLQHVGKFYGHHGVMLQPSFMDPLPMQYFQYPFGDALGDSVQHHQLTTGHSTGKPRDSFVASSASTYMGDQKHQPPKNITLSISSPGEMGIAGNGYYGGPPSMHVISQFPTSPLSSPVMPLSPVGGANNQGRQNDTRFWKGMTSYSSGQVHGGVSSYDDPKRKYFLEELKSGSGKKIELYDIAGSIMEFSVDQHGSRFIQQKLEHCSAGEKMSVFKEVLPHASKLMTDVFGNYVIQKFFEHGTPEQRKELAGKLSGQMLHLSLQMYGCRVIQKALEVIELDQKIELVQELDGHVMRCVRDQNGNHVIQKFIECVPAENIQFIISAFRGQVASLSTHPYGCRVIQRVLEHCSNKVQSQCIVDEILESAYILAQDQYGNYVTQHVLERGQSHERSQIISKLTGEIVQMSQHKYASNVVEKCLGHADAAEREHLIEEIIGQPEENNNLLAMMKDQFANYVVQKILEISKDKQREILVSRIRMHLQSLKKYTYGKHIVARFEQQFGEENQESELRSLDR